MSKLAKDLDKDLQNLGKAVNAKDVICGIKILASISFELGAYVTIIIAAIKTTTILTGGLGALGIPIAATTIQQMVARYALQISNHYQYLDKQERKQLRQALQFFQMNSKYF